MSLENIGILTTLLLLLAYLTYALINPEKL